MEVISLGAAKDLLEVAAAIRKEAASGACGIAVCIQRNDGSERVLYGGTYRFNPELAIKGALRMSVELSRLVPGKAPKARKCGGET